jgi:AcrR family transcriptional regulator
MVLSAVGLLRERGVDGVTLDAVLADSKAPRGSIYHHFPGGRNELVLTAGQAAAGYIAHLLDDLAKPGDPVAMLERFAEFWKQSLIDTDYKAGCPVAGLAANTSEMSSELVLVAEDAFADWTRRLATAFEAAGFEATRARSLATMTLASVEGAVLLCRTSRSAQPLDDVITHLRPLVATST